jgi:proteasome lid subunit RPN8/RPN11
MTKYKDLVESMGKYAQSEYPLEACGLITKEFKFIPSKNLSNQPRTSFMIDPLLMLEYDGDIWGIFHSHPDSRHQEPSEADMKHSILLSELKFILGNQDKFYIYWYDKENKIKRSEMFNENHCQHN